MKHLKLISLLTMVTLLAGCAIEPPLYLRRPVTTKVVLTTKVNVNVMWQIDWQARWDFAWNTTVLGPLGYQDPASMRLHIYTLDEMGQPGAHAVHNFMGRSATMDVFVGTHNLLFHNNDSESLLFKADGDLEPMHSYTRTISSGLKGSSPVYTAAQKAMGFTKADEPREEPVALMPDGLFVLFDKGRVITDNPDDYEYEDGRYVLKITGELYPATYIYLFQIKFINNNGRVVGSNGGAAVTGMAQGVNLWTMESHEETVSVPMDVYMDRSQDMMGARVMTFGLPGCNPYDDASVAAAGKIKHYLVLNISYSNGSWKNARFDVTDQVNALPLGGVIELDVDVDDIPPESGTPGSGGGFNALVSEWDERTGSTTISD